MPGLQLRGFLIGLVGILTLLFVAAPRIQEAQAQNPKKSKAAAPLVTPRVAVLYFDYSGQDEDMGFLRKGLAQMLVTDLSSMGDLQLVERVDLEAVLKELKLGSSGKVDPATRNKIGKLLGARYLIAGGYFEFGKTLRVDAKIIDVERGTTTGYAASAAPNDFMTIEAELTKKLHAGLLKLSAIRASTSQARARKAAKQSSKKRPKVAAQTVARYGRALDALDRGNKKIATSQLEALTRDAPNFKPAAHDLRVLLR